MEYTWTPEMTNPYIHYVDFKLAIVSGPGLGPFPKMVKGHGSGLPSAPKSHLRSPVASSVAQDLHLVIFVAVMGASTWSLRTQL